MKRIIKKIFSMLLMSSIMLLVFCACSTDNNGINIESDHKQDGGSFDTNIMADESLFEWEGNLITAITPDGAKKKSVVIPARCEGFWGAIFLETDVKHVAFEDEDDIALDVAFMGADQLVSVKLPAELTVIPSMAFYGCESLKSITVPANVNTLDSYAFKDCSSLQTITFGGNKITVIGGNSFENCSALTSVTIPEGVTTIEKYAFANCVGLTTLNLSASVNRIDKFAFSKTGIKELYFPEDIQLEYLNTNAFGMDIYTIVVYIVKDSWCDKNQTLWNPNYGFSEIKYK